MKPNAIERFARTMVMRTLRLPKAEEGAVMTEFIIIAPLFVFLVTGTIQFMGIAHADALLHYSQFMAARAGAVHYERIAMDGYSKDFDVELGSGAVGDLKEVMEDAAARAFGPLHRPIAGHTDLSLGVANRPILNSPVGVMDVRVNPGYVQLSSNQFPNLPYWVTAETEIDLGLPFPWVGRVIQAMHVVATPVADEQAAIGKGFDPFANESEPAAMNQMMYGDMPYIVMYGDAFVDMRASDSDPRSLMFPFRETAGQYRRSTNGGSFSDRTLQTDANVPHPSVYPLQMRRRR